MTITEILILFWLLPSLVTLQLFIICNRVWDSDEPKDYSGECWASTLGFALLYPLGIIAMTVNALYCVLGKPTTKLLELLTQEIKLKRD